MNYLQIFSISIRVIILVTRVVTQWMVFADRIISVQFKLDFLQNELSNVLLCHIL